MEPGSSYRPSNGTEGMYFEEKFCSHCINEKYCHTGNDDDLQCSILINAFMYDQRDKEYPKEWQYDANGKPTCTAFKHWDWGFDDGEGGGLNDPPPIEPDDPRQMVLPFFTNDILKDHKTENYEFQRTI